MSLSIQLPDADFSSNFIASILPPNIQQFAGFYLFGTDLPTSQKNLVPGATQSLAVLGVAPTYGAAFASANSATKGYDSGIAGGAGLAGLKAGTLVGGAGGTNGTFALVVPAPGAGGRQAVGTFTVAGGAVTAIAMTTKGMGYPADVAIDNTAFAASAGLAGASATLASEGNAVTQIVVASRATGSVNGAVLCGHYKQTPISERMDGILDGQTNNPNYQSFVEANTYASAAGALADFNFVASVYDGATVTTSVGSAGALVSNSAAVVDPAPAGTRNWYIGSSGYTGVGGDFNIAAAMVSPYKLTQAQVLDVYKWLKDSLATRAITVS